MGSHSPLLITLDYPPQVGGVANYYASLWQASGQAFRVADQTAMPRSWVKMIPWLYRVVKRDHPSHILVGQVLPLGTVALVAHWLTGTPYLVFVHGMDVLLPQRHPRKRWLLRKILRSAHHIIAISQFTKDQLLTFDDQLPAITIIHPAAAITPAIPAAVLHNLPTKFILSVGRLVERKGFDMVIRALVHFPELHYVVAGSGSDQPRLEKLAQEVGVRDRIHIFNDLDNAEVAYLYQQSVCVVMPSRQLPNGDVEGFGIVVLEANSFGKTVIGGKAGGMSDAIRHEQTGLIVDGTQVSEIQSAIEKLLDHEYRTKLNDQARVWSNEFTWEYAAKQLSAIVNGNG